MHWSGSVLHFILPIMSSFLLYFKLSSMAFWDLCAPMHFTHVNSCLLVTSLVSFVVVSSFIILAVTALSLILFMKASQPSIFFL